MFNYQLQNFTNYLNHLVSTKSNDYWNRITYDMPNINIKSAINYITLLLINDTNNYIHRYIVNDD